MNASKLEIETFSNEFTKPSHINDVLVSIGLARLGIQEIYEVFQKTNREHVTRALGVVKHNHPTRDKAKAFLLRVFGPYADQGQGCVEAPESPPQSAQCLEQAAPPRRQISTAPVLHSERQREYIGHHVYGRDTALYFEATRSKDMPDGEGGIIEGRPTINIEAAAAKNMDEPRRGPAPKGASLFDWDNKLIIQVSESELPVVAAVLLGKLPGCEFKHHGPAKDKGFSIQRQPNEKRLFMRIFATGVNHAVQVTGSDIYAIAALLLRQLQAAKPWMDAAMLSLALDSLVFEQTSDMTIQTRPSAPLTPNTVERERQDEAGKQGSTRANSSGETAGHCEICRAALSPKVKDYSINNYGRPLCMTHQKGQQH